MATFANPKNRRAQKALAREVTPSDRVMIPGIIGWGGACLYVVVVFAIAQAVPYWFLRVPIWAAAILTLWPVSLLISVIADHIFEKYDSYLVVRSRRSGHIIDISDLSMQIWSRVVSEVGMPNGHALTKPAAHYDLLLRIHSFDKDIPQADDAEKVRLYECIRKEITNELTAAATRLRA